MRCLLTVPGSPLRSTLRSRVYLGIYSGTYPGINRDLFWDPTSCPPNWTQPILHLECDMLLVVCPHAGTRNCLTVSHSSCPLCSPIQPNPNPTFQMHSLLLSFQQDMLPSTERCCPSGSAEYLGNSTTIEHGGLFNERAAKVHPCLKKQPKN